MYSSFSSFDLVQFEIAVHQYYSFVHKHLRASSCLKTKRDDLQSVGQFF